VEYTCPIRHLTEAIFDYVRYLQLHKFLKTASFHYNGHIGSGTPQIHTILICVWETQGIITSKTRWHITQAVNGLKSENLRTFQKNTLPWKWQPQDESL